MRKYRRARTTCLRHAVGGALAAFALAAAMASGTPAAWAATAASAATADTVSTGPNAPIAFPLFPADNPWNADVSTLPVNPSSAAYIASIGLTGTLHPDFGTVWDGAPNGIPYVCVRGTQPKVPITFYYADESDPGPYPIPLDAPIEGGPSGTGDRHLLTLDVDNHLLYEVYDAHFNASLGRWEAGSGAVWDLNSNALRPDGWTSADAAGLPILPGLVRYDEVHAGEITHALRFTVPRTQRAYVYPATHFASDSSDPSLPPMGLRLRLRQDYDLSAFPADVQVILRALKKYGMIVADNGSPWYISGAPDPRWNDDALHAISLVRGSDFEVVETSGTALLPTAPAPTAPPAPEPAPAPKPAPAAPVVSVGGVAHLKAGRTLSRWGRFADAQGSSWSATVNYGDGRGTRRLQFSAYKRFQLKHRYARRGTYHVTVRVRSNTGKTGSASVKVVVARR